MRNSIYLALLRCKAAQVSKLRINDMILAIFKFPSVLDPTFLQEEERNL